ncbi:MAG: glutamate mutase L [Ignavibacteria bacterium]|nr:glutamate mutase L [Ignavibacteria bacterium]
MHLDVLVAEIGSTTTVVNAFQNIHADGSQARFVGQGQAATTVLEGDVTVGLRNAIENLKQNILAVELTWDEMLATSSAAGGLRMSVHGLVFDMTVRAAREAALGAGAIVKLVTAGKMRLSDLTRVQNLNPNIILVAGGVDYGERDTALHNFEQLARARVQAPVIYAGNVENVDDIRNLADVARIKLYVVENVYPKVDLLNVEPARKVIQQVFEEHIVHAPGMTTVREMVNGPIIPTPGAVMEAAKLLRNEIGNLMVFDVGGATTDVHSVTEDSEDISHILLSPEPTAKRTVEGDLGVYVNLQHVVEKITREKLKEEFPDTEELISNAKPIPESAREKEFIGRLAREATLTALERHAGRLRSVFVLPGKKTIAEGKDLTGVKYIIGTGGALTRLPLREQILGAVLSHGAGEELYPKSSAITLFDNDYIMASLGVLSKKYPQAALALMKKSLQID